MNLQIDPISLLVAADSELTLTAVEAALTAKGFTLDVAIVEHKKTVREWIDAGMPGTRDKWLDPADQVLAGFEANLSTGQALQIRAAPRRSVGPDLSALVLGCGGRFAKVTKAWLRMHKVGVERPSTSKFVAPPEPAPSPSEERMLVAIEKELKKIGRG